jgi:hypothetical protein
MYGLIKTSPTGEVASFGMIAVAFASAIAALYVMLTGGVIA